MTQSDTNLHLNSATLLTDLLHLIAGQPRLKDVAPLVLAEARTVTQAQAAFYQIFDESPLIFADGIEDAMIPPQSTMIESVKGLESSIHLASDLPDILNGYSGWLLMPIHHKSALVGVVSLLFTSKFEELDAESTALLRALIDGLIVVTRSTLVSARHEKLMSNQNEFVRIVSHDLRSPLTSMQGFASMLETQLVGDLNDKQAHFVDKILSGVSQMTSLVENIQDAGRYDPETGFYDIERGPCDLLDVVQKIANNHLLPAEKQELTLLVNGSDDVPIVNIDETMIERAITNLVDNAIKYTPNGGRIEVGVQRVNNKIEITIKDTGFGISDENLRGLFKRHYRIRRREHKLVKGSGLGLFIVRSVALHHGGDAFVESTENEGSTFGIRIPLEGENLLTPNAASKES